MQKTLKVAKLADTNSSHNNNTWRQQNYDNYKLSACTVSRSCKINTDVLLDIALYKTVFHLNIGLSVKSLRRNATQIIEEDFLKVVQLHYVHRTSRLSITGLSRSNLIRIRTVRYSNQNNTNLCKKKYHWKISVPFGFFSNCVKQKDRDFVKMFATDNVKVGTKTVIDVSVSKRK